jgi:hypothetical protein
MARYEYVCSICGSRNVRRDAWATWDVETQSWELATVFEAGFCDDCDGGVNLKTIELDDVKTATAESF